MTLLRRVFVRSPRYALGVIVTLALALAGVDVLLAVARPVLLSPLPFPDADQLYEVRVQSPDEVDAGPVSHPGFLRLREAAGSAATLGAYRATDLTLTGSAAAEAVPGAVVTWGLAETLGTRFVSGRAFTQDEDAPGGPPVAIVSHALWQRRFGGDPGAIGRTLEIAGSTHAIVGILAPEMTYPSGAEIWVPLQNDDLRRGDAFRFLSVLARTASGVDRSALGEALGRIPASDGSVRVQPLVEALLGTMRGRVLALGAAVLATLLTASLSLGVLALVRSITRRGDHVVRLALGAPRGRLAREVVMELAVLGLAASGVAWLIATGILRFAASLAPPELLALGTPRTSWPILALGALVGVGTALLASLLPWATLPSSELAAHIRATGTARRGGRAFSVLMAAQTAVSLALSAGAMAWASSLVRASRVELGFEARGLTEFHLGLGGPGYRTGGARVRLVDDLRARLREFPGVTSVGVALGTPLSGSRMRTRATVDGDTRAAGDVMLQPASPDLVTTLGRTVVEGRDFSADDDGDGRPVAMVSEAAAAVLWPGESPLGRTLTLETEPGGSEGARTVVGVVSDVSGDLTGAAQAEVLVPYAQAAIPSVAVVVRGARSGSLSLSDARRVVAALDPSLPVTGFRAVAEHRASILRPLRLQTAILVGFAALAVLLVLVSVYAVTASLVADRRRELGVRIALGSSPGAVRLEVLRWGLGPVLVGLAAGGALAVWATGLMAAGAAAPAMHLSWPMIVLPALGLVLLSAFSLLHPLRTVRGISAIRVLAS